ncbi:MAG: hypothetical protein J6T61_05145, partial [Spirochaetia bacterium]|nr:hypothetical protein [Spirochaetia bacterium]
SHVAKLLEINWQIAANLIYLRLEFFTGDASGHNMATNAADKIFGYLLGVGKRCCCVRGLQYDAPGHAAVQDSCGDAACLKAYLCTASHREPERGLQCGQWYGDISFHSPFYSYRSHCPHGYFCMF